MKPYKWDDEFAHIAGEVTAMSEYFEHTQARSKRDLISLKAAVIDQQNLLAKTVEQVGHIEKCKNMFPPLARSLLHWSGVLISEIEKFHRLSVAQLGKQMWLKLIRTRTPGNHRSPEELFTNDQVLEMSVRYQDVKNTEELLKQRLGAIELEKARLTTIYDGLAATLANREAASCLQDTFASSPRNMQASPFMNGLTHMLASIAHTVHQSVKGPNLRAREQSINHRVDGIVNRCRSSMKQHSFNNFAADYDEFKACLSEIKKIESDISALEGQYKKVPHAPLQWQKNNRTYPQP